MTNLTLLILLLSFNTVRNNDGDGWGGDKVVWTKFNLIPKPVLSNFTKSFHSAYKNSQTTKPAISVKLNSTKNPIKDLEGLLNITAERKVPVNAITLSSKVVSFPEDRSVPTKKPFPTSTPAVDVAPRRRRRPVIRYEDEEEEEEEDEDDEGDITDEFDVEEDDDDDEDDEEEEVEVVEVSDPVVDVKHEYEDSDSDAAYVEPIAIKKTKRIKKKSKKYLKLKDFKKLRKFMLPLLLAYKLKFFTLIPLLLGGLVLIVGTTGFAGFFFALFAVGLGLQKNHH